jgi:FAD-dependent urate hydroxylase
VPPLAWRTSGAGASGIAATTRKNSAKAAGPVGRVINAWALRIFSRLVKPEKMAWMFDYSINWDTRVTR